MATNTQAGPSRTPLFDLTHEASITRHATFTPFAADEEGDDNTAGFNVIDLVDDDESGASDDEQEVEILQELTGPTALPRGHRVRASATSLTGYIVVAGTSVFRKDGSFFHVKYVAEDAGGDIYCLGFSMLLPELVHHKVSKHTGLPLCRLFPQYVNELVAVIRTDAGKLGSLRDDGYLEKMPLEDVGVVREVVFTNRAFPAHSYSELGMRPHTKHKLGTHTKKYIEDNVPPVCRMKYVEELEGRKITAHQACYLNYVEADRGKGMPPVLKKREFMAPLGFETNRKIVQSKQQQADTGANGTGKGKKRAHSAAFVDLTLEDEDEEVIETFTKSVKKVKQSVSSRRESIVTTSSSISVKSSVRKNSKAGLAGASSRCTPTARAAHTFGDLCAGGGCVTRAAYMLGLDTKLSVDEWAIAHRSQRLNFPEAIHYLMDIHQFLNTIQVTAENYCETIHFSPPCQGHSRRNRNTNPERDMKNNAVCLALSEILRKMKPRRLSMEQTDGIKSTNEGQYFRILINSCTTVGHSVRWKVLRASDHGSVHARNRLIAMASCPGEALPAFPEATHGGPGLKKLVTVNDCLGTVSPTATLHQPGVFRERLRSRPRKLDVADGTQPLSRIIDTGGVQALHPDGDRWFTYREKMALMDLPNEHQLVGNNQEDFTTQIGNGVPVNLGMAFLGPIAISLDQSDRGEAAWVEEEIVLD